MGGDRRDLAKRGPEDSDLASEYLRRDAEALGLTPADYAKQIGIDREWLYDGAARADGIEKRRQRELEVAKQALAGAPSPSVVHLMDAARTLALVERHGGSVRAWVKATGLHPRTAQRRYAKARRVVLASDLLAPGTRAMLARLFPAPHPGRPSRNATRATLQVEAEPPTAALDSSPVSLVEAGEDDLLPAGTALRPAPPVPLRSRRGRPHPAARDKNATDREAAVG